MVLTGKKLKRIYSPIPITTLIGSIFLAYILDRFFPILEIVPPPVNLIGRVMVVAGFILAAYCVVMLISKRTTIEPGGMPSFLLTTGPYVLSRNPIYLADLIIATGAAILLSSLTAFIAPIVFFAVVNSIVIPFEEKNLRKAFGQEYDKYQNSVRRWI